MRRGRAGHLERVQLVTLYPRVARVVVRWIAVLVVPGDRARHDGYKHHAGMGVPAIRTACRNGRILDRDGSGAFALESNFERFVGRSQGFALRVQMVSGKKRDKRLSPRERALTRELR